METAPPPIKRLRLYLPSTAATPSPDADLGVASEGNVFTVREGDTATLACRVTDLGDATVSYTDAPETFSYAKVNYSDVTDVIMCTVNNNDDTTTCSDVAASYNGATTTFHTKRHNVHLPTAGVMDSQQWPGVADGGEVRSLA